jgi:hypothetical protein
MAAAELDEAVADFGLLLHAVAEAEVAATAAATSAIVFSETLIAPLHFLGCVRHRVISHSDV